VVDAERRGQLRARKDGVGEVEVEPEPARLNLLRRLLDAVGPGRVGRPDRDAEDVDVPLELRPEEADLVPRAGQDDAAEENLRLFPALPRVEVDVVDAEEGRGDP